MNIGTAIVQQIRNVLAAIYDPDDEPSGWRGVDPIRYDDLGVVVPVRVKDIPDWLMKALEDMIEGHPDKFRELLSGNAAAAVADDRNVVKFTRPGPR